jgi:DNA-binding winged helix-turn-helix (wHTH) protein
MRYKFNEFEFDSESLLLTNNGETQPIRHSEAQVLALLLEQPDRVLNKNDILSYVWQHKVVSEQVVFQNISHLRNRFGNNAIKTFPKRGYQWQLKVKVVSSETQPITGISKPQNDLELSKQVHSSIPNKKRHFGQFITLACFFIIILGFIFTQTEFTQGDTKPVIKLAYIPMIILDDKTNTKDGNVTFEDNIDFDFTVLSHLDLELFEDSIEITYPKLSKIHPFILTGRIRPHKQKFYLDLRLKGPSSDWKAHLSGYSKEDIKEQLKIHLKHEVIYDLISKPQLPEIRQAKLSIAHQSSPDDINMLRKLSISYLKNGELEKAMVMADKLINLAHSQKNSQHLGKALLYQSNLLLKKKLYDLSSQKLKLAIEQFVKINDLQHQSHAWFIQSRLDDQLNNYPAVKASLLKSAQFSLQANDNIGEIDALVYLSELAHKFQNDDDKYIYLQQAENKMSEYKLPIYHFSTIPFHHAMFAKTPLEKEPHLKQVLKLTALTPEHRIAQSSRRQLMQHYITQNRLIEAQALIKSEHFDNYNNSYLKTLFAQAKQQTSKMIMHAQRTFEQGLLTGEHSLSSDVAQLLCNQQVNCVFYSQYITDNTTESWRDNNGMNSKQ